MPSSRKRSATNGAATPTDGMRSAIHGDPEVERANVAIDAVHTVPDAKKADVAAAAVNAAAKAEDIDIATAAVKVVPEAKKGAVAAAAVNAAPDENKADVAAAAVHAVPDARKVDTLTSAIRNAPHQVSQQVADQLIPDQVMTNKIWFGIVVTFALVLGGTTLALVGAIFVGFWRKVDTANLQILLTVFTTSAGILAGFISGRASTSKARG